ncbi:hypothetical protein SARC_00449 [Sphaeroforma arctica JP610]|uniref:Uncharacterized protein n=1 Tax=Sphaeroforma arctica JP610 TaxID=667725 RepID=A0A0L0GEG0_9EUKA|nr:hypothetical protein SARC_00449 [Sphaeroforma arctica JP610]KNC87412.1 hypothetical protein SARC_00449 [Sphaeroforma arctica JP610]|eukprot:XP_014161314.1 hypothetical protein SARC_00449 [Sphaeroforma arctica JP610]
MMDGKLALVTGASSGIGKAIAQKLTQEGAKVVGTGRNEESLAQLKADGDLLGYVVGDLCQDGVCERIVREAVEQLGGLTTVINCAGVLVAGAMGSVSLDNYLFNFRGNVQSTFEVMEHAIPHLRKAGAASGPCIINISSVNGKQSAGGVATYCASKAAVDQLTRCAAVDLAPDGIRVVGVNPGVIRTPLQQRGGMSNEAYEKFLERTINYTHPIAKALGRVGEPEEVGELVAFLAGDKAKFITGECIAIDGGRQCLGAR